MFFLISFPVQSHQRQHNKDKPYKCPNCYRAYTDSASLQIHLSAHAIKNAKSYCCSMCGRAYTSVSTDPPQRMGKYLSGHIIKPSSVFQETYLMKHMSKHTVVEHLVSHHSPQRTESPSIPIRISLIWASPSRFSSMKRYFVRRDGLPLRKKKNVIRDLGGHSSLILSLPLLALSDIKPIGHRLNKCCLNWIVQFNYRHQSKRIWLIIPKIECHSCDHFNIFFQRCVRETSKDTL